MIKLSKKVMITTNEEVLEFKSFHIFYANLYDRLFNLIYHLIDENKYNINLTKDKLLDFLDNYSYYVISKEIVTRESAKESKAETKEQVIKRLKDFDKFTQKLNDYPTQEYNKIRAELIKQEYAINKLNYDKYLHLTKEYYLFFDEVINILKEFIKIASENGFLPIIKSKNSLRSIGFANYKDFFTNLENLKLKMSDVTTTLKLNNVFKCRRCVYSVLVIFSPYFRRKEIYNDLQELLNFTFLEDAELMRDYKKSYDYAGFYDMSLTLQTRLNDSILKPLRTNLSLIKRYMSFEFGEVDISPKLKKKYDFDPTWT